MRFGIVFVCAVTLCTSLFAGDNWFRRKAPKNATEHACEEASNPSCDSSKAIPKAATEPEHVVAPVDPSVEAFLTQFKEFKEVFQDLTTHGEASKPSGKLLKRMGLDGKKREIGKQLRDIRNAFQANSPSRSLAIKLYFEIPEEQRAPLAKYLSKWVYHFEDQGRKGMFSNWHGDDEEALRVALFWMANQTKTHGAPQAFSASQRPGLFQTIGEDVKMRLNKDPIVVGGDNKHLISLSEERAVVTNGPISAGIMRSYSLPQLLEIPYTSTDLGDYGRIHLRYTLEGKTGRIKDPQALKYYHEHRNDRDVIVETLKRDPETAKNLHIPKIRILGIGPELPEDPASR